MSKMKDEDIRQMNEVYCLNCTEKEEEIDRLQAALAEREKEYEWANEEVLRLQHWVQDLQKGMFINCVYCGHRYGRNDEVPATMADVLKEHIEQCPKHPMSALKIELATWKKSWELYEAELQEKDIDIANIRGHLISSNKSAERRGETIKQLEVALSAAIAKIDELQDKTISALQKWQKAEDEILIQKGELTAVGIAFFK